MHAAACGNHHHHHPGLCLACGGQWVYSKLSWIFLLSLPTGLLRVLKLYFCSEIGADVGPLLTQQITGKVYIEWDCYQAAATGSLITSLSTISTWAAKAYQQWVMSSARY